MKLIASAKLWSSTLICESFPISVPALRPKEKSRVRFEIFPTRIGIKQLLADFSCNKFPAIKAMLVIEVSE